MPCVDFILVCFHNQFSPLFQNFNYDARMSKQYSSCSTIYLDDSTVSQPNLRNTLKTVALAIYFHIKNRENRTASQLEGRLLDIFDEKLHPLTVSDPFRNICHAILDLRMLIACHLDRHPLHCCDE